MTLEWLLNKLVEKGWKPYWYKVKDMDNWTPDQPCKWLERTNMEDGCVNVRSYRDIVSKESGLRQFVCENMMVKEDNSSIELNIMSEWYWVVRDTDYQYRLIESALCDEDKLEEFLLQNIKVEW